MCFHSYSSPLLAIPCELAFLLAVVAAACVAAAGVAVVVVAAADSCVWLSFALCTTRDRGRRTERNTIL